MAILNSLSSKALTITQHGETSRIELTLQSTNSVEFANSVIRRGRGSHLSERSCDIERLENSAPMSSSRAMGVTKLHNSESSGVEAKRLFMKVLIRQEQFGEINSIYERLHTD